MRHRYTTRTWLKKNVYRMGFVGKFEGGYISMLSGDDKAWVM